MGWAHNYSLPREISLAPDGSLVQRPCSELTSMRSQSSIFNLQSSMSGTCITSEETLLQQFPIRISDDLRLSTNRFDLGYMKAGETKERGVVVLHRDERDRKERIVFCSYK